MQSDVLCLRPHGVRAQVIAWAMKFLRAEGYTVSMEDHWETQTHICKRLGISADTLTRRIADWRRCQRQPGLKFEHGPGGKNLLRIASNNAFDTFCRARRAR